MPENTCLAQIDFSLGRHIKGGERDSTKKKAEKLRNWQSFISLYINRCMKLSHLVGVGDLIKSSSYQKHRKEKVGEKKSFNS